MSEMMNDLEALAREQVKPFAFSRPYWEATRQKKLLVQYCRRTGQYQFYPRPTSVFTGRRDLEWREVSGAGEVFSYTIAQRGRGPFRGHEPYVIATIKLDIGINVIGNLVHCKRDDLRIGLRVVPCWTPLPGGEHILMFEPARQAASKTAGAGRPAAQKRQSS